MKLRLILNLTFELSGVNFETFDYFNFMRHAITTRLTFGRDNICGSSWFISNLLETLGMPDDCNLTSASQ